MGVTERMDLAGIELLQGKMTAKTCNSSVQKVKFVETQNFRTPNDKLICRCWRLVEARFT